MTSKRIAHDRQQKSEKPQESGILQRAEFESRLSRTKGGGSSLSDEVRAFMEPRFGAKLSDLRVHTGSEAVQMNHALGSQAFTYGKNIYYGAGKSPRKDHLTAHEVTHTFQQSGSAVQQYNGHNTIQRAVGFEFQTSWGVIEKSSRKNQRPYNKGKILHQYDGFSLTADEADTSLKAEIEWIVDPIQESDGVDRLEGTMQNLEDLAQRMHSYWVTGSAIRQKFTLNQVTNSASDSKVEVYPEIKSQERGKDMKANPQVTGGVRLDQMVNMFAELGNPNTAINTNQPGTATNTNNHEDTRSKLMGAGGQNIVEFAANAARTIPGSASLRGLAAQIITYLRSGALSPHIAASTGQAFDYPKLIGKIMARTDFGSQFKLLPLVDRQPFEEQTGNSEDFVTIILNAANLGDGNQRVFERRVKKIAHNREGGTYDIPVTRREWLIGITEGRDELSSFHRPERKYLESLGAMGNKTDKVEPNQVNAPIVEFRQVKPQMPYTEWRPFARGVFEYLVSLNQRP